VISKVNNIVVDGDTFWAIKVGEWISTNNSVPFRDTFSWTVNGSPWVAHEWLFDYLIYIFYKSLGLYGIVLLVLIPIAFAFYFLWKLYAAEQKGAVLTIIIFVITLMMLRYGIAARPQVFGYMFFAYFLYVLVNKQKLIWTLPLAAIIWANFHGSVLLGIGMVILQFVYESAYRSITVKKIYIDYKLLLISILVPLFSLINPYGIELWKTSFLLITSDINHQIIEWQPPDFNDSGWLFVYFVIIITTVFISYTKTVVIKNKKKLGLILIYLLGTFYEAITGVRYLPYLVICWGIFILMHLPDSLFMEEHWKRKIGIFCSLIALIIILSIGKIPSNMDEAIDKETWPVDAAAYLDKRNTFNDYMWGGYLIYRGIPVFIDGRADVYWRDSDVFLDHGNATRFLKDPQEIFDKYNVDQIIIETDSPLDFYLGRTGWAEKYRDETAVIYLREE
jgi:hypothetical protein